MNVARKIFGQIFRSVSQAVCFVTLAYVFTACSATDPAKQAANPTQDDPSKGIICTTSVPTGSAIKERKCTTVEQREQQRREADHQIVVEPGIR